MRRGVIKADDRLTVRSMRRAIQGDVLRALVELVTNADDSYIRLESKNEPCDGVIEVHYSKQGHSGLFAVRDHAEGMSHEDVVAGFEGYGRATSGRQMFRRVRGYFGKGAKDALATMIDGKLYTFRGDQCVECTLFIEGGKPMYEIHDPVPADKTLRDKHGIDGNGTVASFTADPGKTGTVPQLGTVQEELSNNYLLRKIMTNPGRRVVLLGPGASKPRRLRYAMPKGQRVLPDETSVSPTEHFAISYGRYGEFPIQICIWRADRELSQTGDDRDGGLLVVDDDDVVLDISLFRYDNEPLAARFFGEVRIGRFGDLLDAEEAVLSEEREGLNSRHPFCQRLIPEIETRIAEKVREERLRRRTEAESKIDREEALRYRKAFSILNDIAERETQPVTYLGEDPTSRLEPPPDGFCLYPSSAQISVGKRYGFELRINTKVVPPRSSIETTCTNQTIRILTPQVKFTPEEGTGILRKYITVQGTEPNINGTLRAATAERHSEAKIFVIPERDLLFDEGMAFQPESVTLRPNQPRTVHLLVYVKMISGGSTVKISSDNDSVQLSEDEILVNEADATRHVAKYKLQVWGIGDGQDALITADWGPYAALLEVRVRSIEPPDRKLGKGMFSEPEFSDDPEPLQPTRYSRETGKVTIYANFPSVRHYLGDARRHRKTLAAQVFVADLVTETCFRAIVEKKVKERGALLRPEALPERIQRDAYELSRKYGIKLHQALVDQRLLEAARSSLDP